jgi:hypothetical protein
VELRSLGSSFCSRCRASTPFQQIADAELAPDLTSTARPLKVKAELREIASSERKRDRAVVISSTMPSEKYSCSGSALRFFETAARQLTAFQALAADRARAAPANRGSYHRAGLR